MKPILFAIAALFGASFVAAACTKQQANTAVTVADVACEIVVKVENLPDLCATLAEFARAEIALSTLPASTASAAVARAAPRPITPAELRAEILRQRGTK